MRTHTHIHQPTHTLTYDQLLGIMFLSCRIRTHPGRATSRHTPSQTATVKPIKPAVGMESLLLRPCFRAHGQGVVKKVSGWLYASYLNGVSSLPNTHEGHTCVHITYTPQTCSTTRTPNTVVGIWRRHSSHVSRPQRRHQSSFTSDAYKIISCTYVHMHTRSKKYGVREFTRKHGNTQWQQSVKEYKRMHQ